MENKNTQCRFCKYLDRYYTKETKTFQKADVGWCVRKAEIVNVTDTCDGFLYKKHPKVLCKSTQRFLDGILTQLSALRCIIEDEKNESNEKM